MLTALGRSTELKGHVRGAVNNGASVKEIQETLLHATVYCGFPPRHPTPSAPPSEALKEMGMIGD